MAENFQTIITNIGKEKIAAHISKAKQLTLTHMAIGDGENQAYYEPLETQTALKNERHRTTVTRLIQDEKSSDQFLAEACVKEDIGGFYIREVGLYDSEGELFAISKFPETYKPTLASGSGRELIIRVVFQISNAEAAILTIESSVAYATKEYVDSEYLSKQGGFIDGDLYINKRTDSNLGGGILLLEALVFCLQLPLMCLPLH